MASDRDTGEPAGLSARLNVRCLVLPASLAAVAERWPGVDPGTLPGWCLEVENLAPREAGELREVAARAGALFHGREGRGLLSGPPATLGAVAAGSSPCFLRRELETALAGAAAALRPARPTLVMGILNVTPDSFSDGGRWLEPTAAVEHALAMVAAGAGVVDIGGESTRPGAAPVPPEEELRRVLPVVERLRPLTTALLSVDTRRAEVARRALEAGADWVNDVSALTHDPALAEVVAAAARRRETVRLVLMHSRAEPHAEQYSTAYPPGSRPRYADVVADTLRRLREQACRAVAAGVPRAALWLDPGFGFGKTYEQNVELLRRLHEYCSAGLPVLIGTSRKSSVGRLGGDLPPEARREATAATVAHAIAQGAAAVRVHDVREMAIVARAADALRLPPADSAPRGC